MLRATLATNCTAIHSFWARGLGEFDTSQTFQLRILSCIRFLSVGEWRSVISRAAGMFRGSRSRYGGSYSLRRFTDRDQLSDDPWNRVSVTLQSSAHAASVYPRAFPR